MNLDVKQSMNAEIGNCQLVTNLPRQRHVADKTLNFWFPHALNSYLPPAGRRGNSSSITTSAEPSEI